MRKILTYRVTFEVEIPVTPGEYQTPREMEDDEETYKTLHTLDEIDKDISAMLLEENEIDEFLEMVSSMEVAKLERLPND